MRVNLKYFLNNQLEYIRERICNEVYEWFPPIDKYCDEFESSHIDDNGNEVFVCNVNGEQFGTCCPECGSPYCSELSMAEAILQDGKVIISVYNQNYACGIGDMNTREYHGDIILEFGAQH